MTTYATTRAVAKTALRDRIVVGDTDISFFRGKTTPTPSYRLLEPFGYGSATITVPQSRPYLETEAYGTGELSWVKSGAFVKIQRVDPATGDKTTDYRGRVMSIRANGPELVLEVGGLVTGPASARNHQVPVYRRAKDIGHWMFDGLVNYGNFPGVKFEPRLGSTTGIEVVETGGMSHLGWLQQLCSLAITKAGVQWTCMPVEKGSETFEMRHKDTTTKHCTVYLDDARAVADLVDDAAETFNVGFGTGVTTGGMIWDGTVLPGVEDAAPPPFPGHLAIGSSGDDVVAVNWKLIWGGLLTRAEASPEYDADTAEGVEQIQEAAGLAVTGEVNEATWDALFDVDTLGFDLSGARIMPLVERSSVREWNYTANGSKASLNPDYNPHKLRVDRNIDFGAGVSEKIARQWMRGQMQRLSGKSWVGTIRLNSVGAIAGEHNPGDAAPTAADILSARDIEAGWNVWLANFDGGTLVHVADVQVDGDTVTLTVDTHYRDAIELGEIITRNRESRRDLRREWVAEMRGSKRIHDGVIPFTAKAGINYRKVECPANKWTGFWVFAGEAGTLSRLMAETSPKAEFAMSIWGMKIGRAALMNAVGNPFPVDKDGETVWSDPAKQDFYDEHLLLYAAGTEEQPCGYWPKKHTNRDGEITSAPLTGVWKDKSGANYVTGKWPALWVAIYPDRDTVVQRGRMLWTQVQAGA